MASPDLRRPGHPLGGLSSPTGMLVASEKPSSVASDHQGPAGLGIGRLFTSLQQWQLKIRRFNGHDILLCHPCHPSHQCIPSLSIICYIKTKKQVSLYQKYQGTASERCQIPMVTHSSALVIRIEECFASCFSLLFSKVKGSIPT